LSDDRHFKERSLILSRDSVTQIAHCRRHFIFRLVRSALCLLYKISNFAKMAAGGEEKNDQNKGQTQETIAAKSEGNERPERKEGERDRNQRGGHRGRGGRFEGGRGAGPRGRGRGRGGYHEGRGGFQPKPRDRGLMGMMGMGDEPIHRGGGGLRGEDDSLKLEDDKPREEKKFTGRCRLFVGNIQDMEEDEFKKMFEGFGEISEVYLNKGRGFGFIRLVRKVQIMPNFLFCDFCLGPTLFCIVFE
jgi:hypothetical protein